jgi:hypothetical protein
MTAESDQRVETHSSSQIENTTELSSTNHPITSVNPDVHTPQQLGEVEKGHELVQNATEESTAERSHWGRFIDIISWTPPRCRWNTENPSKFGLPLNILFAFSATFTV